jgi:hypothetical protein
MGGRSSLQTWSRSWRGQIEVRRPNSKPGPVYKAIEWRGAWYHAESDTTMKKTKSGSKEGKGSDSPSALIDARIKELSDWRGKTLARVRTLIKQADPDVVEEWKWRGVPVWEHAGIICTGETYKSVVKLTFAKGASLKDPSGLFNSSLEGNTRRAIDIHEGDEIDEDAFKTLIRAAAALNRSSAR